MYCKEFLYKERATSIECWQALGVLDTLLVSMVTQDSEKLKKRVTNAGLSLVSDVKMSQETFKNCQVQWLQQWILWLVSEVPRVEDAEKKGTTHILYSQYEVSRDNLLLTRSEGLVAPIKICCGVWNVLLVQVLDHVLSESDVTIATLAQKQRTSQVTWRLPSSVSFPQENSYNLFKGFYILNEGGHPNST